MLLTGLSTSLNLANAQVFRLPPTPFPAGNNFCDTAEWKLVFEDDFSADTLKAPWITFTSWASMPGGDNDNWAGARKNGNSIYLNKNVFAKDGAAHLQAWKEPATWRCDTCSGPAENVNYTTAILALPYTLYFSSGRFEARMQMPAFKFAHTTFWTWAGSSTNEIDIAEGYGVSKNYLRWATAGKTYVNYSLHNWPTKEEEAQGIVHEEAKHRYPSQRGTRVRNRLQINRYHVYACEWDTAVVRFYLDGNLTNTIWKWSLRGSSSDCEATGGLYQMLPAFPANNQSHSNLRFTIAIDQPDRRHKAGLLGEVLIDYMRVWQRHPERPPF